MGRQKTSGVQRHSNRKKVELSAVTSLVMADGSACRKKQTALYHKAVTNLRKQIKAIEIFEKRDKEEYSFWVQREFAGLVEEIEGELLVVADLEELIEQVNDYADLADMSWKTAYKRVIEAKEKNSLDDLFAAAKAKKEKKFKNDEEGDIDSEDMIREFQKFFKHLFSGNGDDEEPWDDEDDEDSWDDSEADEDQRTGPNSFIGSKAKSSSSEHIKKLYYQLSRALHPDAGGEMTQERRHLWAETQQAYAWNDLDRLMALYAQVYQGDTTSRFDSLSSLSIGDIFDARQAIEKRLQHIKIEVKEAKNHNAWGFSTLLEKGGRLLNRLRVSTKNQLEWQLNLTMAKRRKLEQIVAMWAHKKEPKKVSKSSKQSRSNSKSQSSRAY